MTYERTQFNHARPLGEKELRQYAPSIFATAAHHSRTERFRPIPTWEVLQGMMREGFQPVAARQQVVRHEDRKPFCKHIVRLRKWDEQRRYSVGDNLLELVLQNANDGSGAYDLMAGMFRVRCLNGMIVKSDDIDSVRVKHVGKDVVGKVIEGTHKVLGYADKVLAAPQDWSQIQLSNDERQIFAESAMVARFADKDGAIHTPVRPAQLLIPRRPDDAGHDLWTTFNVVQENAIRGGLSAIRVDEQGRSRRATTRAVTGIDTDVKVNKALWLLAEKMAELKKAA